MCYDLNEYDPFEPFVFSDGEDYYVDSEPMSVDDWDSWLETMENENEA